MGLCCLNVSLDDDATLQNFIYKNTVDVETVQRNKKKEKLEIKGRQVSSK
jgi:hypothetical protein